MDWDKYKKDMYLRAMRKDICKKISEKLGDIISELDYENIEDINKACDELDMYILEIEKMLGEYYERADNY